MKLNPLPIKAMILLMVLLVAAANGCSSLEMARNDLLKAHAETVYADWHLIRVQGEEVGYHTISVLEEAVIRHGKAANPIAMELLQSFDYRHRCSGLTILIRVNGSKAIEDVLIDHLDDPFGPIRWECWHQLRETGLLELESMPHNRDPLAEWKALKKKSLEKKAKRKP